MNKRAARLRLAFQAPAADKPTKKQSSAAQVNGIRCRPSGDLCAIRLSCSVYSGHCLILFFSAYFLIFRRFFIFRRHRFNKKQFIRNITGVFCCASRQIDPPQTVFAEFVYRVADLAQIFSVMRYAYYPPFEVPQRRSYHRTG